MNLKAVNIVSAVVAAGIAVGAVSAHSSGSADEVSLQSPSLLGPDAVPFDPFSSDALESDEIGLISMSYANADFDLSKYTYVADTAYSDIASEYGKNPADPITYDGIDNWIKKKTVLIVLKGETLEEDSDEVKDLNLMDKVFVISHTKDWSFVKLEDGTQGYVRNMFLSPIEINPDESEHEEEPEDTSSSEDSSSSSSSSSESSSSSSSSSSSDSSSSSSSSSDSSSSSSSSGRDWDETECDKTVYASCALNTRTGPGISYTLLSTLSFGTAIDVVAETDNGWYKSSSGFYVKASLTLDEEPEPEPEPTYDDDDDDYDYSSFASYVRSFIGCDYVYGGASPSGFDCSGLVMYCYATYYNINLPHGATSVSYYGEEVDPDDIQVGDIICFDKEGDGIMEHAGLYVGNDTYVHAKGSAYGVVEDCYSSAKWKIGTVRRVL